MTSVSIISGVIGRINHLEPGLPTSLRDGAKKLSRGLGTIGALLSDANQKTKRRGDFVRLEMKIVELSYEIIDAIEDIVLQGSPTKLTERLSSMVRRGSEKKSRTTELEELVKKLENLKKELEEVLKDPDRENPEENKIVTAPDQQQSDQANPASMGEDQHWMENRLRTALLEKSEKFSVVCIQGKSGMGKSDLAKKVFYDDQVRRSFEAFALVPINQELQTKKVLRSLLQRLNPHQKGGIRDMNEVKLIEQIFNVLKQKKCLILLDDIWAVEDWQSIRVALPTGTSSKIFITTPSQEVADGAAHKEAIFKIPRLSEEECSEMLRDKAGLDDTELQTTIYNLSQGSPLIALVLGKSLEEDARKQEVREYDYYMSRKGEPQVLGVCYESLPHETKPCLLYMGQFPQGQDVEFEKLYLLLAAEDLIPEDPGSMQDIGYTFKELARRKLVEVQEDEATSKRGIYKSCRLHDQVREFCKFKGQDEKFFEIVDFVKESKHLTHRLAIYLNKYQAGKSMQFSSQDMAKKVRSLLIFGTYESEQQSTWPSEINDLKDFSSLRVLDFDGVHFGDHKLPGGIAKIVFLRYLSFRGCWLEALPSYVSKLPCLETLDLRVHDGCKMTVPNIISSIKRLKHIYFPILYESDDKSRLRLQGLERLGILVNFNIEVCKVEDLSELKNLQFLTSISGGGQEDLKAIKKYLKEEATNLQYSSLDIRNFDCYTSERVAVLKELLECKYLNSIRIQGQIGDLPKGVTLSQNFTEIVLNGSELEHDPMTEFWKIKELRSLALSNDAYIGEEMSITVASKFPKLRSLKLLNLQYLKKLTFEEEAMPELSTLVIDRCDCLEELRIPKTLHDRLQKAQEENEGDVYSVFPLPTKVIHGI